MEMYWMTHLEEIAPITTLSQVTPKYGAAVSEHAYSTWFTNKMVYVAVVCFDSTPQNIVVSDSRRDADLNDEDSFLFIFDTYNDQQNGFLFGTNADAMQFDAQIDNEEVKALAIIVNKEALLAEPILTGTLLGKLKHNVGIMAGALNLQFH